MALERKNTDRSYLYGRLMGLVDKAEEIPLRGRGVDTTTAVDRHMNEVAYKPYENWDKVYMHSQHYFNELNTHQQKYFKEQFKEVYNLFEPGEFESNQALSASFILGYYCQLKAIDDDLYCMALKKHSQKIK